MRSNDSARAAGENSSVIIPAYISACKFSHVGYKVPYGILVYLPEGRVTGIGWAKGNQTVVAEKHAISDVLNAIALSERNLRPQFILRTEFVRQSIDFGRSRNKKKQYGMLVRELKTDEELFESTPIMADMFRADIRMADNEKERRELSLIEKELGSSRILVGDFDCFRAVQHAER